MVSQGNTYMKHMQSTYVTQVGSIVQTDVDDTPKEGGPIGATMFHTTKQARAGMA